MDILLGISIVVMLGIFWFKTDFLPEYIKLFRLQKIFKFLLVNEYWIAIKNNPIEYINYADFITKKYNGWLSNLLICYFCLFVWFSLIICISNLNLYLFSPIYLGSVLIYSLLNLILKYSE